MVQDKVGSLDQRKINATKKVESIENWIKKEVEPV
jgi:hypothetical protein